ncbi:MAG: hypothetical protein WBE26_13480 [Phycisphaerae bacterium]
MELSFLLVDTRTPYVGDTQNNSALSLAFGMFGVERFTGQKPHMPWLLCNCKV